ncbi:Protein CBR-ELO-6 [Caenorhabditis briggsae]|uniref:Very-long-chain 3-oxoacyl-CoA synthase n=2 Tax=Caenorhabditis briggsae TaxID=6238 RepID=A0AAE9D5B0_CAEBR|nr:Protein CBR-ELO-6 [Caenorhabditis briggsae]ULT94380.1 hypothetical protein L3Y34_003686 [Caenorhabditis briggsae]UMM27613.1 hypothetical protein L5515_010834 [Caenorhabditis briggsae]CAP37099.1 Protein CBR-ELO-6 [Caenorhabditis briggsae]
MPEVSFLEVATSWPFSHELSKKHIAQTQWPAFWISMAYVVVIFGIKAAMVNRKPFDLTGPLNYWNAALAIFSTAGSVFTSFGLLHEFVTRGFFESYIHIGDFYNGFSGFFTWLFVLSKVAEFGDTLFIVLRKKPLMFLHWYHHVLTMNYAFMSFEANLGFNTWITWMNFSVHSIMYGYYMLRSFGVKVPAWIARNITTMQILQFVITHFILFHVGYLAMTGQSVDSTTGYYWFCLLMEISYVVLFGNFYYQSYIKGGGKKFNAEKKTDKKAE